MRHRTEAFHEALGNCFAHSRELNTRAFACLNRRRRLRFSFCATTVGEAGYKFRGSAHVGFGDTTFRACAFYAGKINAELSRDPACNGRRFHARFFGLLDFRRRPFGFIFLFCSRLLCLFFLFWFLFLFLRGLFCFLLLSLRFLLFFLFLGFGFWLVFFLGLFFFLFFAFGLFLFFFLLFFFLRFFSFTFDISDPFPVFHLSASFDVNFCERPVLRRFPFHCRLIRLDLGENFAG